MTIQIGDVYHIKNDEEDFYWLVTEIHANKSRSLIQYSGYLSTIPEDDNWDYGVNGIININIGDDTNPKAINFYYTPTPTTIYLPDYANNFELVTQVTMDYMLYHIMYMRAMCEYIDKIKASDSNITDGSIFIYTDKDTNKKYVYALITGDKHVDRNNKTTYIMRGWMVDENGISTLESFVSHDEPDNIEFVRHMNPQQFKKYKEFYRYRMTPIITEFADLLKDKE